MCPCVCALLHYLWAWNGCVCFWPYIGSPDGAGQNHPTCSGGNSCGFNSTDIGVQFPGNRDDMQFN